MAHTHDEHGPFVKIDSAAAHVLTGAVLAPRLEELNRACRRPSYYKIVFLATIILSLYLLGRAPSTHGSSQDRKRMSYQLGSAAVCFLGLAATFKTWQRDRAEQTFSITYNLEPRAKQSFDLAVQVFQRMASSEVVDHIRASAAISDRKHHGGADSLADTSPIQIRIGLPPFMICNLRVPILPAGKEVLYFFPDMLLVCGASIGAIAYDEVHCDVSSRIWLQEGRPPGDGDVVGHTYKHSNKSGGPDKRFKDNARLSRVRYCHIHISSRSGLNEMFRCSRPGAADALPKALELLGRVMVEPIPRQSPPSPPPVCEPVRAQDSSRAEVMDSIRELVTSSSILDLSADYIKSLLARAGLTLEGARHDLRAIYRVVYASSERSGQGLSAEELQELAHLQAVLGLREQDAEYVREEIRRARQEERGAEL